LRLRLKDCWQQTLDFIEVLQIGKAAWQDAAVSAKNFPLWKSCGRECSFVLAYSTPVMFMFEA
jgi:hypothetical protein